MQKEILIEVSKFFHSQDKNYIQKIMRDSMDFNGDLDQNMSSQKKRRNNLTKILGNELGKISMKKKRS